MKPKTAAIICVVVAIPIVLFLLSFGKSEPSGKATLTIVSPHWEGIRNEFEKAFVDYWQRETGQQVSITWLDQGGSTKCLRYVVSQFKTTPDSIGADIFWGGGVDPFVELTRQKLVHPYKLPDDLLRAIPPLAAGQPVYDPDYNWYGAALSGFGIIYNKVLLASQKLPTPQTWSDLADPKFYQRVEAVDPRESGVGRMVYEIILQAYGWDKGLEIITRMIANSRRITSTSSQVPKDVANGDVVCGMCIDFYAWAQVKRAGADKVGFALPKGKTVVNPDSIAILKGAPQMELAKAFVRFVMSEPGQRLWMRPAGAAGGPQIETLSRLSVLPQLYKDPASLEQLRGLNPFEWASDLTYDADKGSKRGAVFNDLMGTMLIDLHSDLKEAWEAIIAAGLPAAAVAKLNESPVTEAQVLKLADRWRDDQVFRNQKITEWAAFGKAKYKAAKELAKKK